MTEIASTTIDFLILSHNRCQKICKLINHLYQIPCPSNVKFCIYVIDDASAYDTVQEIKKMQINFINLYLFKNDKNKGTFYNRWFILTQAKSDYIFFIDDDDDISDNLLIEFSKHVNCDLIRTIRKFIDGQKSYIKFSNLYSSIKEPIDMLYKLNLDYITGSFISKFVYLKILDVLKEMGDIKNIHVNILEDTFYFYLMINFCKNFTFIDSYYDYYVESNGLSVATKKNDSNADALKIWNLLTNIKEILINKHSYNVPVSLTKINLWYLMWVGCGRSQLKSLYHLIKETNLNAVKNINFKNKLKCILLQFNLTYLLLSYFVRPFLKIK